jgi:hypothetical protein
MDEAAFVKDQDFIRAMIRYGIDEALFGTEPARRHLLLKDPQTQFALVQFTEAERLTKLQQTRRSQASRQP